MELTIDVARKVLEVVDAGLVNGLGEPVPGKMCVEAAVSFALGLPHNDNPPCVGSAVRALKIALNDKDWSNNAARAKGMRRVAIAQLGSDQIDQVAFAKYVSEQVIRQIVPIALRAAASVQKKQKHKDALETAARECEAEGTTAASDKARAAADADASAVTASAAYAVTASAVTASAAYAVTASAVTASAAAAAADAYAAAAYAVTASAAAAYAVTASAAAADAASAAADAYAAAAYAVTASAAYAVTASAVTASATRDRIFTLLANIAVDALVKLGSAGAQWLDLCPINCPSQGRIGQQEK